MADAREIGRHAGKPFDFGERCRRVGSPCVDWPICVIYGGTVQLVAGAVSALGMFNFLVVRHWTIAGLSSDDSTVTDVCSTSSHQAYSKLSAEP